MSCIIIIVMMMMMMMMTIFDTHQITVVALDGCYKFFKNRRTYKKKCLFKVYDCLLLCLHVFDGICFFWPIRYIRNGGKRLFLLQWICILPGVLEHSKTLEL